MKAVSGVFSIVAGVIAMINFILFLSFVLDRLSQALPGLSRRSAISSSMHSLSHPVRADPRVHPAAYSLTGPSRLAR